MAQCNDIFYAAQDAVSPYFLLQMVYAFCVSFYTIWILAFLVCADTRGKKRGHDIIKKTNCKKEG